MIAKTAYALLTQEGKSRAREEILAICRERGVECTREYLTLVLQGVRKSPCSWDLARIISGWYQGFTLLRITPEDVRANIAAASETHQPSAEG